MSTSRARAKNVEEELGKQRKGEIGWEFRGQLSLRENMVEV